MPTIFHGWIPTVSGALSFSTFGDVSHPPRAISANRTDRSNRYLVCYRARDCSDTILPLRSFFGPLFLNLRGKLWFVCVAESRTMPLAGRETLLGRVFIFHDKKIWRKHVEPLVRDA